MMEQIATAIMACGPKTAALENAEVPKAPAAVAEVTMPVATAALVKAMNVLAIANGLPDSSTSSKLASATTPCSAPSAALFCKNPVLPSALKALATSLAPSTARAVRAMRSPSLASPQLSSALKIDTAPENPVPIAPSTGWVLLATCAWLTSRIKLPAACSLLPLRRACMSSSPASATSLAATSRSAWL